MSLKCGVGLNLTCASTVILAEPWWNPFVEEQAIDRVHRIGQRRDVRVLRLGVRDSVEGKIMDLQQRKRQLASQALGDASRGAGHQRSGAMQLNEHDVRALFGM